jgi:hypothetical protein
MVQPVWKMVGHVLRKFNIESSYDQAIPLIGIYSKELKSGLEQLFVH